MSAQTAMYSIAVILVIAGVTVFTRCAPFAIFGRSGQVPRTVVYLGVVMPAAIIMMLVVYCLRNTVFTAFPFGLPEIIACVATALVHWFGKNTLVSIAGGTILYMVLIQAVF